MSSLPSPEAPMKDPDLLPIRLSDSVLCGTHTAMLVTLYLDAPNRNQQHRSPSYTIHTRAPELKSTIFKIKPPAL